MASPKETLTINDIFIQYPQITFVHIFGSRAKGNFSIGSDIDLALMDKGIDNKTFLKLKNDFEESSLPYRVDLVNFSEITQNEFIEHIKRVGKLFYLNKTLDDNEDQNKN